MLRALVWTLRQRRYRAIAIFMALLAIAFAAIGTFEVHRFQSKRHDNGVLQANAHAPVVPLSTGLVPLVGAPAADAASLRFRQVRVAGTYETSGEQYLDDQQQGGRQGFLVLTRLRTADGVLLVARGFVPADDSGRRPASVAPPPTTPVQITGMLYPGSGRQDELGRPGPDTIVAVNPVQQAARIGQPTFNAYLALGRGQAGTAGLGVLPAPDLSNPTGGAGSLQLLSYVLQWYLFALLALGAPFMIARGEVRDARKRFLGIDEDEAQFDLDAVASRPQLAGAPAGTGSDRAPVLRAGSEVDRVRSEAAVARGARLADRYGRSLGRDVPVPAPDARPVRRPAYVPPYERTVTDSSATPHRSPDDYHGSYNDYLWQLALASGETPDTEVVVAAERVQAVEGERPAPRVIDVTPVDIPDDDDPSEAGE